MSDNTKCKFSSLFFSPSNSHKHDLQVHQASQRCESGQGSVDQRAVANRIPLQHSISREHEGKKKC